MQWLSLLALLCSVPGLYALILERQARGPPTGAKPPPVRPLPGTGQRPPPGGRRLPPIAELPDSTGRGGSDSPDDAEGSTFRATPNARDNVILYTNFDKAQSPYFLKVYDFFAAEPSYTAETNPYAQATGNQQPFRDQPRPTGKPIRVTETVNLANGGTGVTITAFNPRSSVHVCGAWTSLISYCGPDNDACPCNSGAYYVPDQYNSLAASCASLITATRSCPSLGEPIDGDDYWCSLQSVAADNTDYCPTTGTSITTARFGQYANPASNASAEATSTASGDDNDPYSMEGGSSDADTSYTGPYRTIAPVTTHPFESSLFSSLPGVTTSAPAASSAVTTPIETSPAAAATSSPAAETTGSGSAASRTVVVGSWWGVYFSASAMLLIGFGLMFF